MRAIKIIPIIFAALVFCSISATGQSDKFMLTAESLQDDKPVELNKLGWLYRAGDDANWAARELDENAWERVEGTTIKPLSPPPGGWNGRAWFRLHLTVADDSATRNLVLAATQKGASEIYIDGVKTAAFGKINGAEIDEYNPNKLPIPFKFDGAGEHIIAVRFASRTFADVSGGAARWMLNGGVYPGFSLVIKDAGNVGGVIGQYAAFASMRIGFLFVGVLLALALLHFLLYLFYRVERANLFYSIYAAALAFFLVGNNLVFFGHLPILVAVITTVISTLMFAVVFVALLAFIHIAFARSLGKLFWILTGCWAINVVLKIILLNNIGVYAILTSVLIAGSFSFCIFLLVEALREKRSGAWILMSGVQFLALGMFLTLTNEFGWFDFPPEVFLFAELAIILAVPIAVSVFLARNFARTNRDLSAQIVQVETLSRQTIEQERHASTLRAENDRRAKELEEARALQLSMLPRKLPDFPHLEIAAYMKPATEVGGDYYDFHVSPDGTLTVAVGDATGHGLKAGTVVAATKSLFNAFADETDIPDIFRRTSQALKAMNLRGLFMAMTMLKIKDNRVRLSCAGMPSALIYRRASRAVESLELRALPLGGIANFKYRQQELELSAGDLVVVMSDGFPEMFNDAGEMLGFAKAAQMLPEMADASPQEIINRFVETGEIWADGRPPDDDVTFVVLKVKTEDAF